MEENFLDKQMAGSEQAACTIIMRVGVYADPVALSALLAPWPGAVELDLSDNGSVGLKLENLGREGKMVENVVHRGAHNGSLNTVKS